jgi:hypothetical protein
MLTLCNFIVILNRKSIYSLLKVSKLRTKVSLSIGKKKKDVVARLLPQTKYPIKCLILPGCCQGVAKKNRATNWQLWEIRATGGPNKLP